MPMNTHSRSMPSRSANVIRCPSRSAGVSPGTPDKWQCASQMVMPASRFYLPYPSSPSRFAFHLLTHLTHSQRHISRSTSYGLRFTHHPSPVTRHFSHPHPLHLQNRPQQSPQVLPQDQPPRRFRNVRSEHFPQLRRETPPARRSKPDISTDTFLQLRIARMPISQFAPVCPQINGTCGCRRANSARSIGVDDPGRFPRLLTNVCCKIGALSSAARLTIGSSSGVWQRRAIHSLTATIGPSRTQRSNSARLSSTWFGFRY